MQVSPLSLFRYHLLDWVNPHPIGPFVVDPKQAPRYEGATIGLLVGYSIKLGCHLALLGYMFFSNRRRDRVYGPPNREASDEAGMLDQTEFENKDFRYVL